MGSLVELGKASGVQRDGVFLFMLHGGVSLASRCGKPEVCFSGWSSKLRGTFLGRTTAVVVPSLLSVQYRQGGDLMRAIYPIFTVLWSSGTLPFWLPGSGNQGVSFVDCLCSLALARQLVSIGGRACILDSERQLENNLTVHTCKL